MAVRTFTFTVNGQKHTVTADPDTPLLWVLRDLIGLTGTKYGCGIEVCGACAVMIGGNGGETERSCDMSVSEAHGKSITTVEGLVGSKVQQAWVAEQVPQCGYCQSGMIVEAAAMLKGNPHPSDAEIDRLDHICVCGTYQRIRAAIHRAAGN